MKYREFAGKFPKTVFTFQEASLVDRELSVAGLRLQLHRWVKRGDLMRIRRGVYAFTDKAAPWQEQIRMIYPPAYISCEAALAMHGIIPDAPFEQTLVTPRITRVFKTPWGRFVFRHIRSGLFTGYDPVTFLAEPEKAVLDYFYYHHARLHADPLFWQEARWQNLSRLRWRRGERYLALYGKPVMERLWRSLKEYAKTNQDY